MTKIMALSFHNALEAHYYNRENCASVKTWSHQMDYLKLSMVRVPRAQSQSSELNFASAFFSSVLYDMKTKDTKANEV